jgi:Dynamin family
MHEADPIRRLKTYAQSVLTAVEAEPPVTDAAIERVFDDIRTAAQETIRRAGAPVKIGVVGEFNAGKSLLIGSLIGYADALPVSEIPTTGNVTALRFRPQKELRQTAIGPFHIEFLDWDTAVDCLREMLQVAEARSRDAGVGAAERKALAQLREQAGSGPWADVEAWCKTVWNHGGDHPNPALRHLLRELIWFARCCRSAAGTTILKTEDVKARTVTVNLETAREALSLPRSSSSITVRKFEDLPDAPGPMPQPVNADWLRKAFPLVRRVDVEVGVSERIWDLSGMQGAGEWVLLDFPGLGAAESGVRDGFLCKRELREVQTILILLDGRRPGGEGGPIIFNMMNADRPAGQDLRDSILVVINRFDQLPIQADGGELILERLVGWSDAAGHSPDHLPAADPAPVHEKEVLAKLPALSTMVIGARNLTRRDDRIVVFSALWALGDWHKELPNDVPVGSPEFLATLTNLLKAPPPLRLKWERLAPLLREADPLSPLARWLDDVTRDGGLGRLQRLIVEHVAQHGLKQLLDYVKVSAEELVQAVSKLPKKRPQPAGTGGLTSEAVRQAVDALYDVYTALKAEYEQAAPELAVVRDGRAIPLQQHVCDQVTSSVFEWPVWNELLNKVQKDGTIQAMPPSRSPQRGGWDDGEEQPGLRLPADSRAFFEPFQRTLEQNVRVAGECVQQAVRDQLAALAKQTRSHQEQLAPLLGDLRTRQRVEEFDTREKEQGRRAAGKGLWNILCWSTDPSNKEVCDRFLSTYVEDGQDAVDAEGCFPLPGADPNQTPQRFPWARPHEATGGNHQALVLRLRDALADAMRRRVLQLVSQRNKQVLDGLKDTFTVWSERLLILSGNGALLATLVGETPLQPGGPEWKTAAVEYPLATATREPALSH